MKIAAAAALLLVLVGSANAVGTPVEKVVGLLTKLKEDLERDEKVEQQIYDKYACWCEKTSARKAEDIEKAQDDLRMYSQQILKLKGKIATLSAEIDELTAKIKANEELQEQITTLRQKENAAYIATTDEMKDALAALNKAIVVLRNATAVTAMRGGGAALLQAQSTMSASAVQAALEALPAKSNLPAAKVSLLADFASAKGSAAGRYAPQSATIQGILTDMYLTFARDLESATMDEAGANRKYENLWATIDAEIKLDKKIRAEKEEQKAAAEERLAETQQIYDETQKQLKADIVFFDATKSACSAKHQEWTERSSLREQEIAGIKKGLEILTSDEARELFASAIKPGKETGAQAEFDIGTVATAASLLQIRADAAPKAVAGAYAAMKAQATRAKSFRLAALAIRVRAAKVGHFDEVLKAIDAMMQTLRDEDAADIAKRDQCLLEYKEINGTVANLTWMIKNNVATIHKLETLIQKQTEELEATRTQINETEEYKVEITEVRTQENQEFLNAKKEDQDAIKLLTAAREAIGAYYRNNSIEMGPIQGDIKGLQFAQQMPVPEGPAFEISADQAPDATFSHKGSRKLQSKDIISILTYIIMDLGDEIRNGMKAEAEAQRAYMDQMDAADKLLVELRAKEISLEESIAQLEEDKTDETQEMAQNELDLKNQRDYKKAITPDCDWIIGAFEERAQKRTMEMNGLTAAKEYLAGANFPQEGAELLEKKAAGQRFDDNSFAGLSFKGLSS